MCSSVRASLFLAFALMTTACSFPFCQNCKATVNINDANVVINTCVEIEWPDGGVTPCHDVDASEE